MSLHIETPSPLSRRIKEDCDRDPLDALNDAEMLECILRSFSAVIFDPQTRYFLRDRLREDLRERDIRVALEEAKLLKLANQSRLGKIQELSNAG